MSAAIVTPQGRKLTRFSTSSCAGERSFSAAADRVVGGEWIQIRRAIVLECNVTGKERVSSEPPMLVRARTHPRRADARLNSYSRRGVPRCTGRSQTRLAG